MILYVLLVVSNVYIDCFFVNLSKLSQEEYDSIQTQLETTLEVDQRGHPEQIFKVNNISFCVFRRFVWLLNSVPCV